MEFRNTYNEDKITSLSQLYICKYPNRAWFVHKQQCPIVITPSEINPKKRCFRFLFLYSCHLFTRNYFDSLKLYIGSYNIGVVVVVVAWQLNLQLHVQSVPISTKVVSLRLVYGKVYSIQHYVIKFVSDLRQVGGFLHQ